jgi:hypothetical protein
VCEKAKLIRGDPPKIDFKKKGEPPKKKESSEQMKSCLKKKDVISIVETDKSGDEKLV